MNLIKTKGKNAGILEKVDTDDISLESDAFSVNALVIESLRWLVSAVTGRKM